MARARFVVCCALALAACAHGAAPSPSGPFTAPVPELPQRVALSSAPRGDDDWKALGDEAAQLLAQYLRIDRKSTRLNSSHLVISYAVFCLKKKKKHDETYTK